jgi:hypothetical protein
MKNELENGNKKTRIDIFPPYYSLQANKRDSREKPL